jgi:hypothetical protein
MCVDRLPCFQHCLSVVLRDPELLSRAPYSTMELGASKLRAGWAEEITQLQKI